jgi:hypothetical protein
MIFRDTICATCVPYAQNSENGEGIDLKHVSVPDLAQVVSRACRKREREGRKQVQDKEQFVKHFWMKESRSRSAQPAPWQWVDSEPNSSRFENTVGA